jgi:hypothetical protein
MALDLAHLQRLQARGGPALQTYESLVAAAQRTTDDSPQNAALRKFQQELMTDFARTVEAEEAAAVAAAQTSEGV